MHAIVLAGLLASGPGALGSATPRPRIANGVDALTCQWPTTVAMRAAGSGTPFCSGTLIHPEIVMFAAHCIDPAESSWTVGAVGFGESGWLPQFGVDVIECEMHPAYDSVDQSLDLAYCRLAEPVEDVPIVPIIMGCEVDVLGPGDEVVIAGFGATQGIYNDEGGVDILGGGPKRYTQMTVEEVDLGHNDLLLLGNDTGACFGDSGGPAFVALPNGEWRVIGAASTIHPDTQYQPGDNVCLYGAVYELAFTQTAWIEDATGVDVTPCHDPDGTWNPGPQCRDFAREPWSDESSWADGCRAGGTTGWVETCGAPYPEQSEPGLDLPAPDPMPDPDADGGTGDDGSALVGRGCDCGATRVPSPWLTAWLMLVLGARRRRATR